MRFAAIFLAHFFIETPAWNRSMFGKVVLLEGGIIFSGGVFAKSVKKSGFNLRGGLNEFADTME